ncbi:pyridoxamine 5'-phosphate oxidase family protein [Streptomyces sp. NBC_01216]|uniref:pyridoxamine 5'-phosphate oxidase family protein n=1 Tax=Streptomyces sp. NBC_01216 TaxID=2903778 RepID=UPI003FA38689
MSSEEIHAIELLTGVSYGRVATSMRAMPFVAPARHIVVDGGVLLRMHRGLGYHRACSGGVVAYGADNLGSGARHLWSVQVTGTAEIAEPTTEQLTAFGHCPRAVDGEPFDAVYLRVEPRFETVHTLDHAPEGLDRAPRTSPASTDDRTRVSGHPPARGMPDAPGASAAERPHGATHAPHSVI